MRFSSETLDSPAAGTLVSRLMDEMAQRYPVEGAGVPSKPLDFHPPRGGFLVVWIEDTPVACGGYRKWADGIAEIKRMYVAPTYRCRGIARSLLQELEAAAKTAGYRSVRLETGTEQPDAIHLYEKMGYRRIVPYGEFKESPTSVCFEKGLGERLAKT
jgi:ribosomal protein S18 acetylase RimI-like enzyme